MFIGKCVTYIIITLSLISCWPGKQVDAPAWYKNPPPIDTSKLRFEGYYTNISESDFPQYKYTAVNPVFLTRKNKVFVSHGAHIITDSSLFTGEYYKILRPTDFGVYIIEGNKISAFAPVAVAVAGGSFYPVYRLHFTGTIINKELITNWQAVPPFPKRIKKIDIKENPGIFSAHDLKFIQADSIKSLNPE
ncbi:MAG: hypothetical protein ABIR18_14015 [Chitinophagaceae bacterium]